MKQNDQKQKLSRELIIIIVIIIVFIIMVNDILLANY